MVENHGICDHDLRKKIEIIVELLVFVFRISQSVIFKPRTIETIRVSIGFDVKVSFARRPLLRLIKPGDITKEF